MSKSSRYNDIGTILCKIGQMFYEDSFISNISARCNENAEWDFNSANLKCYKGFFLYKKSYFKSLRNIFFLLRHDF